VQGSVAPEIQRTEVRSSRGGLELERLQNCPWGRQHSDL